MEKCHSTHIKHHNYKYGSSLAYLLDTHRTMSPNLPGHVMRITWNACYHGFLGQAWLTGAREAACLTSPCSAVSHGADGRTAVRIIGKAWVPPGSQGSGP